MASNVYVEFGSVLVATGLGAWTGAVLAFRFERNRRADEKKDAQVNAVEHALVALMRAHGYVKSVDKNFCAEVRRQPNLRLLMAPFLEADWSAWNLDLASLEFLLHSEDPRVLLRIIDCESRYLMLRSMMTKRSQMVSELVQPLVPKYSKQVGPAAFVVDHDAVAQEVGVDLAYKICQLADEIVSGAEELLTTLEQVQRRLHSAAKTFFPGREIVFFAPVARQADVEIGEPARVNAPAA